MRPAAVTVILAASVFAALLPAAPAGAAPKTCSSQDMRYPFRPGGPKTFGVFELTVERASCTTARRVARAWMKAFEANLAKGSGRLPRRAAGFSFMTLPAKAAQEYRERGRRDGVTVRFAYRVPNG